MSATNNAYKKARQFRRSLSLPERLLWVRLRGAQLRFRRQHPIGPYVLDFYCPAARIAIEVDSMAHDIGDRPQRDEIRTIWLNTQGVEVLRLPAKQVLDDADGAAEAVIALCAERARPLHHPAPPDGPPPRASGAGRS